MAKIFSTSFLDDDNIPALGLSPIILIWDVDSSTLDKTDTMTEVAGGIYKYLFEEYDATKIYVARCDANTDIVNRYSFVPSETSINIDLAIKDAVWEAILDDYTDKDTAGFKLNTLLHPKVKFST